MTEEKKIEGFFIPFEHEELEDVKKALDLLGYTQDGKGMKELLLDALFGDTDVKREDSVERLIKTGREYIKAHPETVNMGFTIVKNLAQQIMKPRK